MNNKFNLNTTKMLNSILFVLDGLGGKCDFHKIFKILYFADQKHLTYYGVPITGDFYIAMKHYQYYLPALAWAWFEKQKM